MSVQLIHFTDVVNGDIKKRPSQYCKTPYVADVIIGDDEEILGHSPSLGCCGLADKNASVIMTKVQNKKNQTCSHTIQLAVHKEGINSVIIGINPKLGETIAEQSLINNCILNLTHVKKYKREVTVLNSRFDFAGIDQHGKPFVMEIKSVPLADYVDVPKKERSQYTEFVKNIPFNQKISYFPDGYRKKSTDVVSPRALKHIQELEEIVLSSKGNVRAILCFIVQRDDVKHFQTSNIDLTYKEAVYKAHKNGVEIKTIQVKWNSNGECVFVRNDLPIRLKDDEDYI